MEVSMNKTAQPISVDLLKLISGGGNGLQYGAEPLGPNDIKLLVLIPLTPNISPGPTITLNTSSGITSNGLTAVVQW